MVGLYIAWIDIGLVANDRLVGLLLQYIQAPLLRESACDAIHEIISKGMEPSAKTELIESFTTVLESAGVMHAADVSTPWSFFVSNNPFAVPNKQ